jgi:hypothetical protein
MIVRRLGPAASQLRRITMNHSTKLLVIVALGTVLAAPALAQVPNAKRDVQTLRQDWSSRVHVYAPDYYQPHYGNQNTNPDFQLSYTR